MFSYSNIQWSETSNDQYLFWFRKARHWFWFHVIVLWLESFPVLMMSGQITKWGSCVVQSTARPVAEMMDVSVSGVAVAFW